MEGMVALIFLAVLLLVAGTSMVQMVRWVLSPLQNAAQEERPLQYTIADLMALVVLIGIPSALLSRPFREMDGVVAVFILIAVGGATIWAWLLGVGLLCNADVRNAVHRACFLALVLPVAFYGGLTLCICEIVLVAVIFLSFGKNPAPWSLALIWFLVLVGIAAAFLACGKFTRRMVAATGKRDEAGASERTE